jgi:DNA-binding PadR family transcriptional regulator
MPRRKPGTLLPLELSILQSGLDAHRAGNAEFHGFAIATAIRDHDGARRLTGHGTLYRALARMEQAALLESRWEDAAVAEGEGRPRRRLYRVTGLGQAALTDAATRAATSPKPRLA